MQRSKEERGHASRSPRRKDTLHDDTQNMEENYTELKLDTPKGCWCVLCDLPWTPLHHCAELHRERMEDWRIWTPAQQVKVALRLRRFVRGEMGMTNPHMELEHLEAIQHKRAQEREDAKTETEKHRGGAPKRDSGRADVRKRPASSSLQDPEPYGTDPESENEEHEDIETENMTHEEQASDDEPMSDEALRANLEAAIPLKEEQDGDGAGLWSVICSYSTREYHAQMRGTTLLSDLAITVALALTWPSMEINLAMGGCILPLTCPLRCFDPPFQFESDEEGTHSLPCASSEEKAAQDCSQSGHHRRDWSSESNLPTHYWTRKWCEFERRRCVATLR